MSYPVDKMLLQKFIAGACSAEEIAAVNQFLHTMAGGDMMNELLDERWQAASQFEMEENVLAQWKEELNAKLEPVQKRAKVFELFGGHTKVKGVVTMNNTSGSVYDTDGAAYGGAGYAGRNVVKLLVANKKYLQRVAVWGALMLSMVAVYSLIKKAAVVGMEEGANEVAMKVLENPYGRRATFRLSDSSKVYLGPGSKLTYPEVFAGQRREVVLEGEAYFEVEGNPANPFIIRTGDIYTQVLGTSFKIAAFPGKKINVGVTSGKVRVDQYVNGKAVRQLAVLTAGRQVTYNPNEKKEVLTAQLNVQDAEAWLKGKLVFNGTPLHELADVMERWRDVEVEIKRKDLELMPVTVTVDSHVTLQQLLDGLSLVGDFKYRVEKRKVIIY